MAIPTVEQLARGGNNGSWIAWGHRPVNQTAMSRGLADSLCTLSTPGSAQNRTTTPELAERRDIIREHGIAASGDAATQQHQRSLMMSENSGTPCQRQVASPVALLPIVVCCYLDQLP